jgi:hypothetical protein
VVSSFALTVTSATALAATIGVGLQRYLIRWLPNTLHDQPEHERSTALPPVTARARVAVPA